jgi:hypothetical protein
VPTTQGKTWLKVCNKSETSLKQLAPRQKGTLSPHLLAEHSIFVPCLPPASLHPSGGNLKTHDFCQRFCPW